MSLAPALPPQVSPAQPVPVEYDLLCEACGYSLLGLFSDRCPECGKPFDPAQLPLARVPWLYRARLGRWRAYVQTVWMILRRPRAFAAEMCRPVRVSAADAKSFRRVTLRLVVALYAIVMLGVGAYGTYDLTRMGIPFPVGQVAGMAAAAAWGAVGLMIALATATDLPTFIWRGLPASPDDLAPLHHYACAPLALVPVLAVIGAVGWFAYYFAAPGRGAAHAVAYGVFALAGVAVLLVWWMPAVLMRAATGCGRRRMLALAAYLPVHWVMMLALGAMVFVIPVGYINEWLNAK